MTGAPLLAVSQGFRGLAAAFPLDVSDGPDDMVMHGCFQNAALTISM